MAFRVAAFSMVKGMAVVKILLLPADFVAGAETGCSETEAVAESPARQISSLWKMAKHDVKSDKVLNSNHATRNGLVETRDQAGCFYTVGALVAERAYASSLWALEVARRIKHFFDWSQTYPEDRSKPFKPAAGTNQGRTGSKSRATDKEQHTGIPFRRQLRAHLRYMADEEHRWVLDVGALFQILSALVLQLPWVFFLPTLPYKYYYTKYVHTHIHSRQAGGGRFC